MAMPLVLQVKNLGEGDLRELLAQGRDALASQGEVEGDRVAGSQ